MQVSDLIPPILKPPLIRATTAARFYGSLTAAQRATLAKNRELQNTHAGKRCFILGNGPSLKDIDPAQLCDEYTFCVNSFLIDERFRSIEPWYCVLADNAFFDPREEFRVMRDRRTEIFSHASERTSFFLPVSAQQIRSDTNAPKNKCNYFDAFGLAYLAQPTQVRIDPTYSMSEFYNVVQYCIALALYMGFDRIYLLGCEHDRLASPGVVAYGTMQHFYTETAVVAKWLEHKAHRTKKSYEGLIDLMKITMAGYRVLAQYAQTHHPGVVICNLTPNSFLDTFLRDTFQHVIKQEA